MQALITKINTHMMKNKDKNNIQKIVTGPTLGLTDNFSKRDMWKQIAKELNGEFKIKYNSGSGFETHNISIPYKTYEIEISVSDTKPMKFQISFSAIQDFDLILSGEDFFDRIIKKIRNNKIEVGWKEFDNRYLIKSNSSALVKEIITRDIQKRLLKHNVYTVNYHTNLKSKTSELVCVVQRSAGNKEMIFDLLEMHKQLIDNFKKMNIIA